MKHGVEDGSNTLNGAAVMGPGQVDQSHGNRSPLSAATINLSRPRHRR